MRSLQGAASTAYGTKCVLVTGVNNGAGFAQCLKPCAMAALW